MDEDLQPGFEDILKPQDLWEAYNVRLKLSRSSNTMCWKGCKCLAPLYLFSSGGTIHIDILKTRGKGIEP